jgi:peptide/nickel transport system permease protein
LARTLLVRLILGIGTVWLVSLLIFAAVEALPGDACVAILQRDASGTRLENCRAELGLNRPATVRYVEWASAALRGDLGVSAGSHKPIAPMLGFRLRNTLLLAACALGAGVPLALLLGIIAALRRDRAADIAISVSSIALMTIPEFVSATVLIFVFSIWLDWVPGIVMADPAAPLRAFLPGIVLPTAVLAMVMTAHMLRTVRSSVLNVLASDHVQMARLKGVPPGRIIRVHVLPSALLPAINVVALTVAWLLGGVVVVEKVFNYPGLGRFLVDSITERDLPVVQAIALLLGSVYVGVNLIADIMGLLLNPRLRTRAGRV